MHALVALTGFDVYVHVVCITVGIFNSLMDWISDTRPQGCTDLQSPVNAWIIGNMSDTVGDP